MREYLRILSRRGLLVTGAMLGCYGLIQAQSIDITASVSPTDPMPSEAFTLIFEIDETADIYYMAVEVTFDNEVATFIGIETGNLMEDGLEVAGLIEKDRVGASVSRTSAFESSSAGSLMKLTFLIHDKAPGGESFFGFSSLELADSNGEELESTGPQDVHFSVQSTISDLILILSADNEINRGEVLDVAGKIYVNGWTDVESEESADITVWFGLNSADTDPSGWNESVWTPMSFNKKETDGYHSYAETAGYQAEAGVYFIALRAQFEGGSFRYGGQDGSDSGSGGFWDGDTNHSARLDILDTSSTFIYTIAEWNFDDETYLPWRGLPVNRGNEFGILGATMSGFSTGSPDRSANSNGWNTDENGIPYWVASFNTENLKNITISSKQYGSGTGPRNFKLQGRVSNESWEDIPGGEITVESNWTSGVIDQLGLPSQFNNQQEVSIRWRRVGNINVNGDENLSASGSNRIDEVIVRGENMNPVDIIVWPGDVDNDGSVDEEDVLDFGVNWMLEGPTPVFNTLEWEEREVEGWIPSEATSADTDGNGVVDHRDLKIIGLNFGNTRNTNNQETSDTPLAELVVDPPDQAQSLYMYVITEKPIHLTGLSYRLQVRHHPSDKINVEFVRPGKWAEEWFESDRLLSFDWQEPQNGRVAGAFVHLGYTPEKSAGLLLTLELPPMGTWAEPVTWVLDRISYTDQSGQKHSLKTARLELSDTGEMVEFHPDPDETVLDQNYPNPFNPKTHISYSLSNPSNVRLEIFNISGRRILTLIDQKQVAGFHTLQFDATGLASGIYIYRLRANEQVFSKRMLLVK